MHALQDFGVAAESYLYPTIQVVHSVAFVQDAQFFIQATQVLGVVVDKVQPSRHKVQTDLFA